MQGSTKFLRGSTKVPQGSAVAFLMICHKGSLRLWEGFKRFLKISQGFGFTRFRRIHEGSGRFCNVCCFNYFYFLPVFLLSSSIILVLFEVLFFLVFTLSFFFVFVSSFLYVSFFCVSLFTMFSFPFICFLRFLLLLLPLSQLSLLHLSFSPQGSWEGSIIFCTGRKQSCVQPFAGVSLVITIVFNFVILYYFDTNLRELPANAVIPVMRAWMLGLAGVGGHRQIAQIARNPRNSGIPKTIVLNRNYARRGFLFEPGSGLLIGKLCASRTQKDPYR